MQPVHVQCPNGRCRQKLRLKISENHLGKNLEVTCSSCKEVFRTFIPEQINSGVSIQNESELLEQLREANDSLNSYYGRGYR